MNLDFLNSKDRNGKTALMYAVESGNLAIINAVLYAHPKPNVNDRSTSGETAFTYAAGENREEIIKILSKARDHTNETKLSTDAFILKAIGKREAADKVQASGSKVYPKEWVNPPPSTFGESEERKDLNVSR